MKKIILYITTSIAALLLATSCEKKEIGGTATEAMAGEWIVSYYGIDSAGNNVYDDPFGWGHYHLDTYNTSKNGTSQMWIDDHDNSYGFKNLIDINLKEMTFSADEVIELYYGDTLDITNGKIIYGAATTPSGTAADSIVFDVLFKGDQYAGVFWERIRISGYRYTGLTSDDPH